MADEKKSKQIIAVSSGRYRGVDIYQTPKGFAIALGVLVYVSQALISITSFIDNWYEMKNN